MASKSPSSKKKNTLRSKRKKTLSIELSKSAEKDESKNEKRKPWIGEPAAKTFIESLSVERLKIEFKEVGTIPYEPKLCKGFYDNMLRNRSYNFPVYDHNRVKPTSTKGYINATKLTIAKFSKQIVIAQLPVTEIPGALEDFWKMVYDQQATQLYLLATKNESKKSYEEYFPVTMGAFCVYGIMWVNNRKAEDLKNQECIQFIMEILPKDCSDSVLCTISIYYSWPEIVGPSSYAKLLKTIQPLYKDSTDKPVIICSMVGSGRAATCAALAIAIQQVNSCNEPNIKEIVKNIRQQRPKAVDSIQHYGFIYLCLCFYLKRKVRDKELLEKTEKFMQLCKNVEL